MTSTPATATTSTTARVAQVLLAVGQASEPVGVSEIARACALSKAVVHRILQSLVSAGLLTYVADDRLYTVGPGALSLGRQATRASEVRAAAMPVISHLAEVTGETTTITERFGHSRRYVGLVESAQPIRITIRVGDQVPLWSGASGLSILAFMDADDIDYVLSADRTQYTAATMTDESELRERMAEIRERGWAHTAGERVRYSSSVAAPIFDLDGAPAGSLSVAYLVDRLGDDDMLKLAELVVPAAAQATERLHRLQKGDLPLTR